MITTDAVSVKLHLKTQTDKRVRLFVCTLCLPEASILWVDEARSFKEI